MRPMEPMRTMAQIPAMVRPMDQAPHTTQSTHALKVTFSAGDKSNNYRDT